MSFIVLQSSRWGRERERERELIALFKLSSCCSVAVSVLCSYTPASNLGYLAPPPGQFFMGAKLFIGTPWMGNEGVLKKNWFGLCEIAWFLCQPIANLRRWVCL